ncbi:hypothetical protein D3C77_737890 [compost metagenome]
MVPIKAAAAARRGWGEAEGVMGQAPLIIFLAGENGAAGRSGRRLCRIDFSARDYD